MAFSDINRAVNQTGTTLTSTVLQNQQDNAEDDIRAELETNGLDINPSPIPYLLQQASFHWTCRNIYLKHKHDGTLPNTKTVGDITQTVTIDQSIQFHDQKGREALDKYIASVTADDGTDDDCLVGTTGDD